MLNFIEPLLKLEEYKRLLAAARGYTRPAVS